MVVAETIAAAQGRAPSASRVDYEPLPAVTATPGRRRARRADPLRAPLECLRRLPMSATPRRPRRRSRARPTWCGSTRGCSASPACRWSRAPRSASTMRRADATRSMPARAAWCARSASSPASSACRRATCASMARDVGGNFGTRNSFYPEFALVAWAAQRLGRPVKWTCERREAFLSDYQGRDLAIDAGAGARRRRPLPRAARLQHQQHRRAQRLVRAAGEGRRAAVDRSIGCPPAHIRARARAHQHAADQRRTAAPAGRR